MHAANDIRSIAQLREATRGNPQLADIIARQIDNAPPGVLRVPYLLQVTAKNTPTLLIPKSVARVSFDVCFFSGSKQSTPFYSYDYPIQVTSPPDMGNNPRISFLGFVGKSGVNGQLQSDLSNGTVAVNDIYVWVAGGTFVGGISWFVGFEAVLSPTGNPR